MWARHVELALGLWLAASPFVLRYPAEPVSPWLHEFALASLATAISLASYWRPPWRVHLLLLLVAAWLVAAGWWGAWQGATPASQNRIVVGLCFAMLAIVPSDVSARPDTCGGPPGPDR